MKSNNKNNELAMVVFATGIILILFLPIPSWLLDFLLIINFSWALTILLLTFYTDKPLSFSTFPALLLISTLFRLALNISATRLILGDGDAGQVIAAIGQYVINNNYVMGLVVFLILIIVQFIVVTNGAQRVAEVAARFTLDSMPGKQMSIDADLNMGIITHQEAKLRRSQVEKEANFYGAMDGASKFVKGDAIAGILIILVDILGGFAVGMIQKGLSMPESIQTYSLLTVGDGLVTQIPALIISIATGIIVTRAATDAHLGSEVSKQIAAYPKSLIMVCFALLGLLVLKGMPILPVLSILILFLGSAWFSIKNQQKLDLPEETSLYEQIRINPIEITFNIDLAKEIQMQDLLAEIQKIKEKVAHELGIVIPNVSVKSDPELAYPYYQIAIQGNNLGINSLYSNKPALIMHLQNLIYAHLPELLTRAETEMLLDQINIQNLKEELIPSLLSLGQVQHVLQTLLEEKVSIRPLAIILEVLLDHSKSIPDPILLTELVRAKLASPICQRLVSNHGNLEVLTLAPPLEQKLNQSLNNRQLALEPELTERFITALAQQVEKMHIERKKPILLCAPSLRRQIKQLTQRIIPNLTVLAMNEIPIHIPVESFNVVK
jgi:flagellar biosynthesis protein FlhA